MVNKKLYTSTVIRFTKKQHEKLRRVAFDNHVSANNIVVAAVEKFLKKEYPKSNITNKQEFPRKQEEGDLQL